MESIKLDIFLSCSFQRKDAAIVNLVRSICSALDLNCINVAKGYAQIPPEKASEYINKVPALIAIATRRQRFRSKEYSMPSAVRDELFMAYGKKKPILLLLETGVRIDGFLNNIGTHLPFSKDSIWNPSFIEQLVASIHAFKMHVLPTIGQDEYPHSEDYFTELYQAFIELENSEDGFVWNSSWTRRIKFLNDCRSSLRTAFWPDKVPPTGKTPFSKVEWGVQYESGSQDFELKTIVKRTPTALLDLSINITPKPRKGEFIQYTLMCKSKQLFPIYLGDSSTCIEIENRQYTATAGVIRSTLTDTLKLVYKFPKEYGLDSRDISGLVATYSTTIDRLDKGEMERNKPSIESFGGTILVNLVVSKPVLGRFYGIAWIPPTQRESTRKKRQRKTAPMHVE